MQPSTIILNKELSELKDQLKTASPADKVGIKARIKEIETLLNPSQKTDEPNLDMVGEI